MTSTGIATRYAHALVESLFSTKAANFHPVDALSGLNDFVTATREAPDLDLVLLSPAVSPERKRAVVSRMAEAMHLSPLVRNFLFVLSDHRRMSILREVAAIAPVLVDERLGFLQAHLTAPSPLSPEEEDQIAGKLGEITGKNIRVHVEVDPELLGGVIARVGSTVYDGSIRGQLRSIGERLAAGER